MTHDQPSPRPDAGPGLSRRHGFLALLGLGGLALAGLARPSLGAEAAVALPPPALDPPSNAPEATAVLAGGCFWGVQGVYQHVIGVRQALSGYAGGEAATAHYEIVGSGRTGHAESVRVRYDPRQISYAQLLQVFFSVVHDPTQRDRQGPDVGPQYRSALFPQDEAQARIAQAYITQLNEARVFPRPIATTLEAGQHFYPAEGYHQDYLTLHPDSPYIAFNDLPKIENLQKLFPSRYRAQPVLVGRDG
jgi:peptide-methionine (S)-S-oxide reductase